jgi:serpin B
MATFRVGFIGLRLVLLAISAATSAATIESGQTHPRSFALTMLETAASRSPQTNVALSPLSVGDALAVAAQAADGRTARQFDQVLGLPLHKHPSDAAARLQAVIGDPNGPVLVRSALWVPETLQIDQEFTTKPFDAPLTLLPASSELAAERINAWAAAATHGAITNLVDSSIDTSGFIVTNATYFKGAWKTRFNPEATTSQEFFARGQPPHPVAMMRQSNMSAMYWSEGDLEAVRLPFEGDRLEYIIITSRSRASADEILKTLGDSGALERLYRGVGFTMRRGIVAIPRHRVDFSLDLKEGLMRCGLTMPFGRSADFSNLSHTPLYLSAVHHRSVLLVDETGAEAAASTAVLALRSFQSQEPRLNFVADRPFVAVLVNSGALMANSKAPAWPVMMTVIRDLPAT